MHMVHSNVIFLNDGGILCILCEVGFDFVFSKNINSFYSVIVDACLHEYGNQSWIMTRRNWGEIRVTSHIQIINQNLWKCA